MLSKEAPRLVAKLVLLFGEIEVHGRIVPCLPLRAGGLRKPRLIAARGANSAHQRAGEFRRAPIR